MNEETKGLQASAAMQRIDRQVTATPPAVGEYAVMERAQLLARIAELEQEIERLQLVCDHNKFCAQTMSDLVDDQERRGEVMTETVKRYIVSGYGGGGMIEAEDGVWYHEDDYARLEQECERLRDQKADWHGRAVELGERLDAALASQIKGCTFCGRDEHMTAVCPMREGWKLVPVEPTNRMVEAMHEVIEKPYNHANKIHRYQAKHTYKAMLAAAPSAGSQKEQGE